MTSSLLATDPSRRRLPMAGDKTVPRGQRRYANDLPRCSRHPPEEFILCDGEYINPQVEFYAVLPKASTRRQMMKRAMCLKGGCYGNAVIIFSLTEAEKTMLNSMGSPQVVIE